MTAIHPEEGLISPPQDVDEVLEGEHTHADVMEEYGFLEPVDNWSDIDPNYVEFLPSEELEELDDEDPLTDEETEPLGSEEPQLPYWVTYELHGRNLDEGSGWNELAREDFDGELEVHVEGLVAGARWEFRIRLIDNNGRHSKWSEPLQITLPVDFTPPPRPIGIEASNYFGFVNYGWGGQLEGEIPEDFSHLQFYLQQMHPEGNPEGEPGDPVRLDTLATEGRRSTGNVLPNVLYRIFATAVDTTGNESPWSDHVEVTPEPPVDRQQIEDELSKIEGRVGDALDQQLTVGLQGILDQMADREESVIDRAKRESAEAAQEHYDRLQEAADRALAQARRVDFDGSFETDAWDDLSEYDQAGDSSRFVILESANPHSGTRVLSGRTGSDAWIEVHEFPVAPGQVWRVRYATRRHESTNDAVAASPATGLRLFDQEGSLLTNMSAREVPGDRNWHVMEYDQVIPDGVSALKLRAYVTAFGSNYFQFDSIEALNITLAKEALDAAEYAAWAAAEAHQQAGSAEQTAQNAMDRANAVAQEAEGIPRIFSSTSAPSGTAPEGSVWYRWSSTGTSRNLMGVWTREGDSWRSMGTLEPTLIPLLDVGQQTVGQLEFERISGFAAEIQHLAVGDFTNLMPEEAIWDYRNNRLDSPLWDATTGNANGWISILNQLNWPVGIRFNASQFAGTSTSRLAYTAGGKGIPVRPGDEFTFSWNGWVSVSSLGSLSLQARYGDDNLGYVNRVTIGDFPSGRGEFSWTVPDDSSIRRMQIEFTATSGATGNAHFGDIQFRRKVLGVHIGNGAVKAVHVDVQDLAADIARMNELWVGFAGMLEASIDQLFVNEGQFRRIQGAEIEGATFRGGSFEGGTFTGSSFEGGSFSGGTFTGGEFRTASNWNTQGGACVTNSDQFGHFRAVNSSGRFVARLGGDRNELRDLSVGRLAVDGELRVGGNGEGGIIPDNGRVRFVGRMPDDAGPEDQFVNGATPFFTPPHTMHDAWVTYAAPAPTGNRLPVVSCNLAAGWGTPSGLVAVTSMSRQSSQFRYYMQPLFTADNVPRTSVTYLATWGQSL